jgi:hypothetical protein
MTHSKAHWLRSRKVEVAVSSKQAGYLSLEMVCEVRVCLLAGNLRYRPRHCDLEVSCSFDLDDLWTALKGCSKKERICSRGSFSGGRFPDLGRKEQRGFNSGKHQFLERLN